MEACEKLLIYDDTTAEDYIQTVRSFLNLKQDYEYLGEDGITTTTKFEAAIDSTTTEVLGHAAFGHQMEYLRKMKKSKKCQKTIG